MSCTRMIPILVMGILLGPSTAFPQTPPAELQAREVWATKGPSNAPFAQVTGVVEAGGGVVIADEVNAALYRFEPESRRWRIWDRKGEGPGELKTPTLLTVTPDGQVALYDIGHHRVLLFTPDLQPVGSIRLEEMIINPKGFAFLDDGRFLLSGGRTRVGTGRARGYGVHLFDTDGSLKESYIALPESEQSRAVMYTAGGALTRTSDGGVLFTNSAPHQILRFTAPALAVEEVARDPEVLDSIVDTFSEPTEFMGRPATRYRWFYAQSRAVFPLAGDSILNIITREYRGDSIWELWRDGSLLRRARVPVAYRPFDRTKTGRVLAVRKDPETDEHVLVALDLQL